MILFVLSCFLLVLTVDGQGGYGRQAFGSAGGGDNFNPAHPFYGRGFRHRNTYDFFPNNGPSFPPQQPNNGAFPPTNGAFAPNNGGFDPQSSNNAGFDSHANNNNFQGTDWSNWGNSQQTPSTDSSARQFEAPNQSPPQVEVQPGPSAPTFLSSIQPVEGTNADIDTTGARTFGKSNSGDVSVSDTPSTDTPFLPAINGRSLSVDLPLGATGSEQRGVHTAATSTLDPNSSKLIPEPPVLG